MANKTKRLILFSKREDFADVSYKYEIDAGGIDTFTVYKYNIAVFKRNVIDPKYKLKPGHYYDTFKDKLLDVGLVSKKDVPIWAGVDPALAHRRAFRLMEDLATTVDRGGVYWVKIGAQGVTIDKEIDHEYDNRRKLYTFSDKTADDLHNDKQTDKKERAERRENRRKEVIKAGAKDIPGLRPRLEPKYSKRHRIISPRMDRRPHSFILDTDEAGKETLIYVYWYEEDGVFKPMTTHRLAPSKIDMPSAKWAYDMMKLYLDFARPKKVTLFSIQEGNYGPGARVIAELDHDYNATRRAYDSITNHTAHDIYTGN